MSSRRAVAAVTGAVRGLGQSIADRLAGDVRELGSIEACLATAVGS